MDCLSLPTPPDHPRIRGEHHGYFAFRVMMVGSSPHTRGALADGQARRVQAGIIPAYAGSTPTLRPRGGRRGDHPRIRGEHVDKQLARPFFDGSSPHTRGARVSGRTCTRSGRIIPAYAGSTSSNTALCHRARDHPRIRGEHRRRPVADLPRGGSSPHTRGARHPGEVRPKRPGIIPAYAGSTRWKKCDSDFGRDHPRIRGEHITRAGRLRSPRGSSPHTRGAQPPSSIAWGLLWDHPRIRGEHRALNPGGVFSAGSSPHTRGAQGV